MAEQIAFIISYAKNSYDYKHNNINNHEWSKTEEKKKTANLKQDNESILWSNAFNFKKSWGTQVDPRIGIFSAYIKSGSLLSNFGHGPNINLEVIYSSNSFTDKDGLGIGWSWNLTHFNPRTHQLTTSLGQNFYLTQRKDGHWWPMYHKLQDIYIRGDIKTHFVITYANGLRETLNHDGYETRLEQQDGWSVRFIYKPGTHLLQSVIDDKGHAITLYHAKNKVIVVSKQAEGKSVSVFIDHENNHLHTIILPLSYNNTYTRIKIDYKINLITKISYPSGLTDEMKYNCTNAMKINIQAKSASLCVISTETINPGTGEPASTNRYQYSDINDNKHDYLAYNSGLLTISNTPKDILFDAPVNYTYRTQQDNGIIREIRTYNKYHLLIDDQQISNSTGNIFSEIHTFFCRIDEFDGCAHTVFTDLPPTYSLPLKTETLVWGKLSDTPTITLTTSTYNKRGRLVSFTDSYGRLTKINYCPVTGDTTCPAAPKDWPFSVLIKSVVRYPADKVPDKYANPVMITNNYYRKIINHTDCGYTLILDHQTYKAGQQQITIIRHYYQNTDDTFSYGLLKQTILTGNAAEDGSLTSLINNYYYTKSVDGYRKTAYSATVLDNQKYQFSSSVTTSLFTNQILKNVDPAGKNITLYHYDSWGRLIQTDFAAGTSFATSKYYQYTVSDKLNQVIITAPNGLQKKILFDGAGRVLMNFDEALTVTGKPLPNHWWLRQSTTYNQYGQIATHTVYHFDSKGSINALTAMPAHDYLGRVTSIHLSSGETNFVQYDDTSRCVVNYQINAQGEYSALSVSRYNVLNKPVKYWVLPAPDRLPKMKTLCLQSDKQADKVSSVTYDGFGRVIAQTYAGKVIRQYYSASGQVTDIIDPAGNRIHKVYNLAGLITATHFFGIHGDHYLLSSAHYNAAGQLIWHTQIEGKKTFYHYNADGLPVLITIQGGHRFSWQYNFLGLTVSEFVDNKQHWSVNYDKITALPIQKTDITGTTFYTYSIDGMMRSLIHTGKNGYPDYKLQWNYNNNRRIINATDICGNVTKILYDKQGRIRKKIYHAYNRDDETLASVRYNGFSRIKTIYYGSGMQRNIHYDRYGHQSNITDLLGRKLISQWRFNYDRNDNIITLYQKAENGQYGIFNYKYDVLNNLLSMTCHGSAGFPLCPRDTVLNGSNLTQAPIITQQKYSFTSLNQLKRIVENLQNPQQKETLDKVITYHYTNSSAPLRIQQISTSWNKNTPVIQHLMYDLTGNITIDERKNHITYNAFNKVTEVITQDGHRSTYAYDGSNKEIMEKHQQNIRYLFYRSGALINEKINTPGQPVHITGYQGLAKTTDGVINTYYENNYKGDIVSVLSKTQDHHAYKLIQRNVYSPYGMVWHKMKPSPHQTILYGFDGGRTDSATGWQFLGAGNRVYNPQQRYFLSEDPLGTGYCFAGNNPVMNTDPDGNMPQWLGTIAKWAGYIGTAGLGAVHHQWATIAASVIAAGLTIATLGATVIATGGASSAIVATGIATVGSSIPVLAAAIPANKGLNIASAVAGIIQATTITAIDAGFSFFSAEITEELSAAEIQHTLYKPRGMLKVVYGKPFDKSAISVAAAYNKAAVSDTPNTGLYIEEFLEELFISKASHLLSSNNNFLKLKSMDDMIKIWRILSTSACRNNIECDTATILITSVMTKQQLNIELLKDFLIMRRECLLDPSFTKGTVYLLAFEKVINSVANPGSQFTILANPVEDEQKIKNIVPLNTSAIISSTNHMSIVRQLSNGWEIYQFIDDGSIVYEHTNYNTMLNIFRDKNKVIIDGFMLLE